MEIMLIFVILFSLIGVMEIAFVTFSLLFMHYSAKYRNQTLSPVWYICGVIFGLWTLIVFLIKREDFPGPDAKVCSQCSNTFPETFQACPQCLTDLPENDIEEKNKQKKKSRIFGALLIVVLVLSVILGIASGVIVSKSMLEDMGDFEYGDFDYRISVDGGFYDKKGIFYEDENSVVFYDEDGRTYTYLAEPFMDEDELSYEEYYVRDDGQKYFLYDCYVTEDGWFYCDKAMLLEPYDIDTSTMTQEELDAYYNELLEDNGDEYRYYDYPYVDAGGNIYYSAYEASWNADGELITAENDVPAE